MGFVSDPEVLVRSFGMIAVGFHRDHHMSALSAYTSFTRVFDPVKSL